MQFTGGVKLRDTVLLFSARTVRMFSYRFLSVVLILVPFMPTAALASAVLIARYSISYMDVPTRQSLTMSIVQPGERSTAAGVTGVARTTGASLSPAVAGQLFAVPSLSNLPFIAARGLKIVYDLLLLKRFRKIEREG